MRWSDKARREAEGMTVTEYHRGKMAIKLSEQDVVDTVVPFLELDGWRALKTDPVSDRRRGKGFGEIGMPDYLFIRYDPLNGCENCKGPDNTGCMYCATSASVLWVEFKAPGKKPTEYQLAWHEAERKRGALVKVVDDFAEFRKWYMDRGLARRML